MTRRKISFLSPCLFVAILAPAVACAAPQDEGKAEVVRPPVNPVKEQIEVSQGWVKLASDPDLTACFVAEAMVKLYETRGEKPSAVVKLGQMLSKYENNVTLQRVIRFKRADVYIETGQYDKALRELLAILDLDTR